jgi:hypothetical protein
MSLTFSIRVILAAVVLVAVGPAVANGGVLEGPRGGVNACRIRAVGGGMQGATGVIVQGACERGSSGSSGSDRPSAPSQAPPLTRAVSCRTERGLGVWDPAVCGQGPLVCPPAGQSPPDAFAIQSQSSGGGWGTTDVWCAGMMTPMSPVWGPSTTAVRQAALRLLPAVGIGVAPPGGATLVNMQTLLWASTPATRDLAKATVVGVPVAVRLSFSSARWAFGDGATETTTSPGRAFTAKDFCNTAMCPGFFGHVYSTTGAMTVSLSVTWSATFSVDGGANWQPIPGSITGPASTVKVTVKEARGVLVQAPTEH